MSPDQDNSPDLSVNNTPDTDSSTPDPSQAIQSQTSPQTQLQPSSVQASPQSSLQALPQAPQATASAPTAHASGVASNTAPVPATDSQHPLVRKAGVLAQVAQALAGGPRTVTTVNDDGTTSRTEVPLSRGAIGFAIALEALSGSLTGLSAQGPNAAARGGAMAFEQAQQRVQQQKAQAEQQAQTDAANRSNAFAQKAAIAHTNMATAASASESQARGLDSILKLVEVNRSSGLLDLDPELLDGTPITGSELLDRMSKGTLNIGDQLGPIAGATAVTDKNGDIHYEPLHQIIKNPNALVELSPKEAAYFKSQSVQGFAGTNDDNTITAQVPVRMKAWWAEQAASNQLAVQRLADLREALSGTPLAAQVPTSIDLTAPGVQTALRRYSVYQSHDAEATFDPYVALQKMGAAKRDKDGQLQQNADAKYVDQLASTMGGWNLLQKAHQQIAVNQKNAEAFSIIDTADKAQAVLAAPKKFGQDQVSAAKGFLTIANQQGAAKASQEARARAVAEGTDVQAMYKTGVNPITGERLTILNALDSMLIDSKGRPVPQVEQPLYKPTAQERQTADTARQVLAISGDLQAAIQKNPALIGPLSGRSKQGLAKIGIGDAEAQTLLDNVSFLQTAATKMHTGRFSNQILDKMSELIKPGMNPSQMTGALSSINAVAQRYAQEDKLVTVADYKEMQNQTQQQQNALHATGSSHPVLTNIQVNPQTHQRIGWNGSAWVDAQTGIGVK